MLANEKIQFISQMNLAYDGDIAMKKKILLLITILILISGQFQIQYICNYYGVIHS